jgi:hypothetical protein
MGKFNVFIYNHKVLKKIFTVKDSKNSQRGVMYLETALALNCNIRGESVNKTELELKQL